MPLEHRNAQPGSPPTPGCADVESSRTPLTRFLGPRYWPTWLLLAWMRIIAIAPIPLTIRAHERLGRWLAVWLAPRAHVARRNLELCFPALDERERERLLLRHFEALGACLAETAIAWFARPERLHPFLELEGMNHLEDAVGAGKGVLLFTGHFTALEVTGPLLAALTPQFAFMFSRRRNALLDEIQSRRRARIADVALPSDNVRALLKSLGENQVVWYAADQAHHGPHAKLLPFFGEPAMTNTAVSRIARISGAAVVPFFYHRRADDIGYVLTFHAPPDEFPSEDAGRDTGRLVAALEDAIRRTPEQYFWNQKKFHRRPPPLPDAYARPARAPKAPGSRPLGGAATAWTSITAAIALLGSTLIGQVESAWAAVDIAVYASLTALFPPGGALALPWSIVHERWFDDLALLGVTLIYFRRFLNGSVHQIRDGLAVGIQTALVLTVCMLSAALLAGSVHAAADAWSSPGTTASALAAAPLRVVSNLTGALQVSLLVIAWLWGRAAGRRLGLAMLALAAMFALPHLAAATFAASDLAVGAGSVALLWVAAMTGTRAGPRLQAEARRGGRAIQSAWSRAVRQLSEDGSPPLSLPGHIARGVLIGATQLVPGLSSGSTAFVLGVYQRLLRSLARLDGEWLRLLLAGRFSAALRRSDFLFLASIAAGIVCAPFVFSRAVPLEALLAELPEMTYGLIFGLIAASIVSLLIGVGERRISAYGWLVAGVVLALLVVALVPVSGPNDSLWFLFVCGLLAVIAMMIPGLSGALVLLVLGKYAETLDALARLDLAFLLPLAAGVLAGAVAFSRLMTWLLDRYRRQVMLTMVGVLGGSLLAVWPFQEWVHIEAGGKARLVSSTPYLPQTLDFGVVLGVSMMLAGVLLHRWLERVPSPAARDRQERRA